MGVAVGRWQHPGTSHLAGATGKSEDDVKTFLHKIPTYAITDQDRGYEKGTPYHISSHQWMRKEFEEDLLFIWDECAWKYQNGTGRENWSEYKKHIQNHGNLGKVYPKYKYGVEGDTPAFLHVLPTGLNNPMEPGQVGWGGYFEFGLSADDTTKAFTNHKGKAYETCRKYEYYFYQATFNDFAARMDWAAAGTGNRNPVLVMNGDDGLEPVHINGKEGEKITLYASDSYDPDNDKLNFKWWVLAEAGSYKKELKLPESNSSILNFEVPSGSSGKNIHIICEITDNGEPELTSYRRIIVNVK